MTWPRMNDIAVSPSTLFPVIRVNMSHISGEEKSHQIKTSFEVDRIYLQALEDLRQELIGQGIDIDSGEGRKIFIRAVRALNERFV